MGRARNNPFLLPQEGINRDMKCQRDREQNVLTTGTCLEPTHAKPALKCCVFSAQAVLELL